MNKYLQALFGELNIREVKYILLTDYESDLVSNDIDLFVHPDSKDTFENILIVLGWYKRKEPTQHLNHHFYYNPSSELYLGVKFSLSFANGADQCFNYKETDRALKHVILNSKGIARPRGIDAIILYAAHLGFKERGKLELKHRHYLNSFIDRYRFEVDEDSQEILKEMQSWLDTSFPYAIHKLQQIIKPYFTFEQKKMVRNKKYLKYGYGVKVLFLGTDGAGKTTLIESVGSKLNLKISKLYLGMGENGWTSKYVKKLYHYKFKYKILNKFLSFLKTFVVLPLEFILRILPVKLRSKYSVVLIDRLPGSVFLDNNIGKKGIYKSILPKPDLVFFLYAAPEVLVQRKPTEITLEKSRKDIKKFEKVAKIVSDGAYIGIDTSKLSISQASDFIISEIYKNSKVYDNLLTAKLN